MKKILIIISILVLLIFLSGCSSEINIDKTFLSCEDKAKKLFPKYLFFENNELDQIIWNDNSTNGCVDGKFACTQTNSLNRHFNYGSKTGENVKYLYSDPTNRNKDYNSWPPYFVNQPIIYSKQVIENDIIIGTNTFEIENIVLNKLVFNETLIEPEFNFTFNDEIVGCFIYIGDINYNKKPFVIGELYLSDKSECKYKIDLMEKFLFELKNNNSNIIGLKSENLIVSKNQISEFQEKFEKEIKQYKSNLEKYNNLVTLKEFSENRYEVISYDIINCNFVK